MINSYPKVYAIGHPSIPNLFEGEVIVEEKVDGSQFSFGLVDGELQCRSHNAQIILDAHESMFSKAIETALELAPHLVEGFVYRCEYLRSQKHNTLAYDRAPNKYLIGFDIMVGPETYMGYREKQAEFERIGLECVPLLARGNIESVEVLKGFLERTSILGGSKIEGIVVKNHNQFSRDAKPCIGKYVSEAFKEVHGGEWRKNNPAPSDVVDTLTDKYTSPARWQKSVNHLREDGLLADDPTDIGKLILGVVKDVESECEEEIKAALWAHFWPKIKRGLTRGLPEWYKDELAKSAFETKGE